ncbi:MAG: stage III sporulation protein AA [Bacillota bacterium]
MGDPAWLGSIQRDVLPVLAPPVRRAVESWLSTGSRAAVAGLEELRLRQERPLVAVTCVGDIMLDASGRRVGDPGDAFCPSATDVQVTLQLMTGYSLYTREEELRSLFLTLSGGHRVGLAGRTLVEGDRIRALQHVAALSIRLARAVTGCATGLISSLVVDHILGSTLVLSPPGAGKTTLLRDLARLASNGLPPILRSSRVGIVDERSELAACLNGVPQLDVGFNTDVLDGCPKAQGIALMLRCLNPQLIVTDEVGRPEDGRAILDAINAGVRVLVSAHGRDLEDIARRPAFKELLEHVPFDRFVVMSRRRGPGTVERVTARTELKSRAGR